MSSQEESFDVVVVGAGWNGLISAATYLELVPDARLLLIERQKSLGGVWSNENVYPNLFAQVGHGLFEYSSKPMSYEGITDQRYISGATVNRYLHDFAQERGLLARLRLDTSIAQVEKQSSGSWKLLVEGGSPIVCDKLIYAAGATSAPLMPDWPRSDFEPPVMHSSKLGSALQQLRQVKRVTVVGAAKSAYDTVFLLARQGKSVNWIIRADGTGPLSIAPPTMFGFNTIDLLATRFVSAMSPTVLSTADPLARWLQQTVTGRFCARAFWKVVNWVADYHAGYSKSANSEKLRPKPTGEALFWCNASLGCASVPDFWKVFHQSDTRVIRSEVARLGDGNTIYLEDGTSIATDMVIVCSGYTHNYHTFSEELREQYQLPNKESGSASRSKVDIYAEAEVLEEFPLLQNAPELPTSSTAKEQCHLYRWLVSPNMVAQGDRSIYFPGLLHTPFTPLIAEVQALWGCAFMLGMIELPSRDSMNGEVALWNAWTRRRYLAQGEKHAYAIYDFLSYIDTMLRDLGIETMRKGNLLADLALPYRPSDYRGLIGEFLALRERREAIKAA